MNLIIFCPLIFRIPCANMPRSSAYAIIHTYEFSPVDSAVYSSSTTVDGLKTDTEILDCSGYRSGIISSSSYGITCGFGVLVVFFVLDEFMRGDDFCAEFFTLGNVG